MLFDLFSCCIRGIPPYSERTYPKNQKDPLFNIQETAGFLNIKK
jgi:hypothetical protein